MHDIEFIRNEPDVFDRAMRNRGGEAISSKILELDVKKRKSIAQIQELKERRNILTNNIANMKLQGKNTEALSGEAKNLGKRIKELEATQNENELQNFLATLPNIPAEDVPVGDDESHNIEIRKYKKPTQLFFEPKAHDELGLTLGMMNFKDAAKISGSRFVMTTGVIAHLERALINFMLDLHTAEFGYTEVMHPSLVKDQAMYGVGQLPKFDQDSFKTTNGFRLIPTSEVFLTNIVSDSILSEEDLPLRFVANSACFRSEAGSAGCDTRGIIRQHQFNKVELVSITKEFQAKLELERMTGIAEEVLKLLDLPYRVVLLCTGDIGFSAKITYDLEVWLPSQNNYREISSCSYCGDFQARRMKARYREGKKISFVHTLNGSALAIGRTIAAIMENYQNNDGSIRVPKILQPYLAGKSLLQ